MKTLFFFLLIIFIGCNTDVKVETKDTDSLDGKTVREWKDSLMGKMTKEANEDIFRKDTAAARNAPIKILSAKMIKASEYSNYKSVYLTYKNVTSKTIVAVKFKWYGIDAFGDPADMGSYGSDGFGGGFSEDRLRPGGSDSGQWDILSSRGKKILAAWPYEVVFSDDTKWEAK